MRKVIYPRVWRGTEMPDPAPIQSDNLRPAPGFLTGEAVKHILDLTEAYSSSEPALRRESSGCAATPGPPKLELVPASWLSAGGGAATNWSSKDAKRSAEPVKPFSEEKLAPDRASNLPKWHDEPEFRRLIEIAYRRGVAMIDFAQLMGRSPSTMLIAAKRIGYDFGKRPPLAATLSVDTLVALNDDAVPLPELRSVRVKRERLERENRERRAKRALAKGLAVVPPARPKTLAKPASAPAAGLAGVSPQPLPSGNMTRAARNSARFQKAKRAQMDRARATIAAGASANRYSGTSRFSMLRVAEQMLADEARLADPLEQAKTFLRQRGRVVYSMSVHGGAASLFFVSGLGKDVTVEQLLELAERLAK